MLVPNQFIEVCWRPQTREYYIEKGCKYTKMRDKFMVSAEDLSSGSHKKVKIICDYCGKEFSKQKANYINERTNGKDCCSECRQLKAKESFVERYGVENPFQYGDFKNKSKQTCLEKYGTEYACQSEQVKEKICATNLEKYGKETALCNPEIKDKAEETCMKKFGVSNVFMSAEIQEKIKQTNREKYGEGNIVHTPNIAEKIKQNNIKKYGVPYVTLSKEIQKRMRNSLFKNGKIPSSKGEKEMCEILNGLYGANNCKPSFPVGLLNLDCLVDINGVLIDFEYDGWYWHKEKQKEDMRRNYFLIRRGYKVCRFRANNTVPTKSQIQEAVEYLLNGHSLNIIDLDI